MVALPTLVVGQSTISNWPTRCASLIRSKSRWASVAGDTGDVVGGVGVVGVLCGVDRVESVVGAGECVRWCRGVLWLGPVGWVFCALDVHAASSSTAAAIS
jgi:hypothetical protein